MVINSRSLSNTKGFEISAFFVEYWVMMKNIALVFKASPKVIDNMVAGFVQAMVPKEVLKRKKLQVVVGMRKEWKEWMRTPVTRFFQ